MSLPVRRHPIGCEVGSAAGRLTMVGTMHEPPAALAQPGERIAFLLLNAGPAPRAGNSDLSAHLADRLARRGIPGFRFDLPRLGDSTGPAWPDIDTFWQASQRGENDEAVTTLVNDLCIRYRLRGVLLGGLCAGAIASVRVGEALAERIAGLVLLEPNFRATAEIRNTQSAAPAAEPDTTAAPTARRRRLRRTLSRILNPNELLYILTGESRYARPFRPIKPLLEGILARRVGKELPPDVLMPAVMSWRRLLDQRVPSLVVLAQGLGTDRYMDRIHRSFPPVAPEILHTVAIPETNHILTAGDARRATEEALDAWVAARFPKAVAGPAPRPAVEAEDAAVA